MSIEKGIEICEGIVRDFLSGASNMHDGMHYDAESHLRAKAAGADRCVSALRELKPLNEAAPSQSALTEALKAAKQFIENGIELGYIQMPTGPDPANDTLPMINAALAARKVLQGVETPGLLRRSSS